MTRMTPDQQEGEVPAPPTATYRMQLQPAFPFAAAAGAVPYLASLGVSHLHLSPVLEAVPGSTHGYDVVDHARVRDELGGEAGLRALARTAREHGLGLIADIVPNHMASAAGLNRPLQEVLRDGPHSPYAHWFDIDWEAQGGRVLLPVLGHRLGHELDHLEVDGRVLRYYEHAFPLREGTETLPLPELLDAQWYRLGWWRLARTELNYRRFFTISDLIGVRVENREVFDATHGKIVQLLREGVLDGLRVDHPDGLADPGAYLKDLADAAAGRWTVVEKILGEDEQLPAAWPVAGTTGYDALRRIDGLFTDPSGADELLGLFRRFTAAPADLGGDWDATARRAAYKVVTHELAAEVDRLTREAGRLCAADAALRDHAAWALRAAVRELLVRLDVYRPYVTGGAAPETVLTPGAAEDAKGCSPSPRRPRRWTPCGTWRSGSAGRGPNTRRSGRGSRRRRPRCAPRRSRTRRSTGTRPSCRRRRSAGRRRARRWTRSRSTRTARACSATGRTREPSSRRTTPSAAPMCGRGSPCSRSVPGAGPICSRTSPSGPCARAVRARPIPNWPGRPGRRRSGSATRTASGSRARCSSTCARPGCTRAGPSRTRTTRRRCATSWPRARAGRPGRPSPRSRTRCGPMSGRTFWGPLSPI